MGSRATVTTLQGFGLPHSKTVTEANLVAVGAGATDSSYSQASPQPGPARADQDRSVLVPRIHNAQSESVDVIVRKTGLPGIDGVRVSYRPSDETAWRGWSEPLAITMVKPVAYDAAEDCDTYDVLCLSDSQELVLIGGEHQSTMKIYTFDGSDWSAGTSMGISSEVSSLVELDSGRILWGQYLGSQNNARVYYSDDSGTTWDLYSEEPLDTDLSFTPDKARLLKINDDLIWIFEEQAGSGYIQYASSDNGATFVHLETGASFGTRLQMFPLLDGSGIGIIYTEVTTGIPKFLTLGNAYSLISAATATSIDGAVTNLTALGGCQDYDGILYVYGVGAGLGYSWKSADYGATWEDTDSSWWKADGDTTSCLTNLKAFPYRGGIGMIGMHLGWGAANDNLMFLEFGFGGWSNLEINRGFGSDATYGDGITYVGQELPNNHGWSLTGAAAPTISTSSGDLQISTVAAGAVAYYSLNTGTEVEHTALYELAVTAGR